MSAYEDLQNRFARMATLDGAVATLSWDYATMMPNGGAEARSDQMALLGVLKHEMQTAPELSDLLDEAEEDVRSLSNWQKANLQEMRRNWRHASAVDADLVEALSRATSECEMIWRSARQENRFSDLLPSLEEVVSLTQKLAAVKSEAFGLSPYDALLDQYEPGCTEQKIETLFSGLKAFLPNFLDQVLDKQDKDGTYIKPKGMYPIPNQKEVGLEFMTALGFDFNHGRLDISHHPFTGGIPDDVRLTTRYEEDDFTQSLMGTLHETGHALYEQHLPKEWRGQPVGDARGMALHESQSLLVEMQLSRSEPFLRYAYPILERAFGNGGDAWTFDNLKKLYHHVERGFIRVDADEVTYPLHIILRFDLERALLDGGLKVADLPGAWNDEMYKLLRVSPPTDSLGCMQDIHWPGGAIGYFPTYTLGALAAAQIFKAASDAIPDLDQQIEKGSFQPLMNWLKTNIHEKASSLTTDEILLEATGSELGSQAFIDHLISRYL
ncbi:carboxypeptidase M32 [Sneathiella limimaris]|uniref:carboxypeptidase M32 n=1 Tax=Sneathiella limimaris TaxID=1964213 RepID=UPI00146CC3BC|nr:carboxypeptidase M32 [Sneathiella limimaris]